MGKKRGSESGRRIAALAAGLMLAASAATAQAEPTVASAQQFIATMLGNGAGSFRLFKDNMSDNGLNAPIDRVEGSGCAATFYGRNPKGVVKWRGVDWSKMQSARVDGRSLLLQGPVDLSNGQWAQDLWIDGLSVSDADRVSKAMNFLIRQCAPAGRPGD